MAARIADAGPLPTTVRTAELDRLERTLETARKGRSTTSEVAGDPGTGKTRLLTALTRRAEGRGARVLRGRCSEVESAVPYRPFIQAFSTWQVAEMPGGALPQADALIRALADGPDEAPDDVGSRCRYYAELRRLIGACLATEHGPVLLVLDDYHWADAGTAELLETLIHWPVTGGLAVVVAHRPRQIPAGVRAPLHDGVEQGIVDLVELPALDLAQSAAVLGVAPDDPSLGDRHERAAGNPLYLLALAAAGAAASEEGAAGALDAASATTHDSGVREAASLSAASLSAGTWSAATWSAGGLAVRLHAEITPLDALTRTVLQAAAVLGDTFTVDAVSQVAGINRTRCCAILGDLRRRDLVRPAAGPGLLTFRHFLLRQALYDGMDACWKAVTHQRALTCLRAQGTPATELAPHIERLGSGADSADRRDLATAARTALHLGRPDVAARWLTLALRLDRAARADRAAPPDTAPVAEELWQSVVQHLAAAGDAERVSLLVREILTGRAGELGPGRPETVAYLSGVLAALGRDEEAQTLIAAELSVEAVDRSPDAVALLHVSQQVAKVLAGQVPARADVEALVRRTADAAPVTRAGALALRGMCAVVAGDTCSAEWALISAAQTLDELDDGRPAGEQESTLLLLLSWAEALMSWYGPAHGHAERALAAVRARGDAHLLAPLLDTLGYVHYQSGRMPDALTAAQECRDVAKAAGRSDHVGLSDAITAAAWAQLGRRNASARAARPPAGDPMVSPRTPLNALLQAEAYLAAGDGEAAFALLLPRREAWRVSEPVAVLAARGYELLAAAAVTADLETVGVEAADVAEWAAHSADAAAAVGIAEQSGHALLARGHALLSRRQTAEAAQCYEEAVELLGVDSPAGARARELARERARELAGDPARRLVGALAELTVREKEVAALAGEGCKTKEIALRLTVSPRTVDAHLTRIYSKLGVNSRAELARLVALAG
ncbi:AAA family ATPase [Streptomyces sp. ISL-36]|uniref:ATP-binding protein n=1 Tax=Streptomyces sp. ISL-36 TaxID=2819182 RepID=UPI001BE967EF|nr:AAA family ATPase [Streptomyces sp. ISL-36]MBT2442566.1 AAA family ATPase [Streptomyces sp. ISL-36]